VVQTVAGLFERLVEEGKINDHTGLRIWTTTNDDLGTAGMTMDPATWLNVDRSLESVRRIEAKFPAELVH
jgi:hypothetical protein